MRTSLQILDSLYVDDPCSVAWDSMTGTDRIRFCSQCKQSVYDVSSLSANEAAQLIQDSGGDICVRFYRRPDGTLITKDCAPIRALAFSTTNRRSRERRQQPPFLDSRLLSQAARMKQKRPHAEMGEPLMGKIACPALG